LSEDPLDIRHPEEPAKEEEEAPAVRCSTEEEAKLEEAMRLSAAEPAPAVPAAAADVAGPRVTQRPTEPESEAPIDSSDAESSLKENCWESKVGGLAAAPAAAAEEEERGGLSATTPAAAVAAN
jgi:hypothetical protein